MHLEMKTSVRQLRSDTTASYSALVNMESSSNETTSILATSHKERISLRQDLAEMKMMLAALMSSDGRAILPKLVSKPEALRKICDSAGIGSADDATNLPVRWLNNQSLRSHVCPEFQCTCNPRRVSKTRKRRVGLAFIEQECVTDMVHSHWCPFAHFNTPSHNKWSFGISATALRGISNAALTLSMSATFGAGGFGLSPSFTYFPIREDSPALRVLSILQDAFEKRTWSGEEADHLLRRGIQTLQATVTARKWSPFDIDRHGCSLLDAASSGSKSTWQGNQIKILAFFLSLGVPRDRPNNLGAFPFHEHLGGPSSQSNDRDHAEAFDMLWPDGLDTMPVLRFGRFFHQDYADVERMENHMVAATISARLRKLYENHLMEAIIRKSKTMLVDIIKKDRLRSEISDMDAFGYKMFHYLLGWPDGLRIVIEQCGDPVLELDNQRQVWLLECALKWSGRVCTSSNLECCPTECTCGGAVEKILEAERSYPWQLRRHEHWVLAMLSASAKARDLVIDELSRRRQELKKLGLLHLSPKQIDRMDLRNPKVLDYSTGEVLEALKTAGISVSPRLETEMEAIGDGECWFRILGHPTDEIGILAPLTSKAVSVYHLLGASPNTGGRTAVRALASSLYSKGFSDIDLPNCAGVTPLAGKFDSGFFSRDFIQWNWDTSIEAWLIEHGASLETQIPHRVTGYTTAHHVFRWIGFQSGFTKESSPFSFFHSSWKSKGGFTQRILDTCRCKCSISGCNPYNIMWKILVERFHAGWRKAPSDGYGGTRAKWTKQPEPVGNHKDNRHDHRQRLMSFLLEQTLLLEEACELPQPVKSICLRACTFAMLPLRHTCCDEGRRRCDDEEIREIWEEDQADIGRLEILMDEFEKKLGDMGCGLAEFYRAYWINRMEEVLREMDEQILSATEMEDVERLGVKLTVETEAFGCEKTKTEDENSLEYWIERMDTVVE